MFHAARVGWMVVRKRVPWLAPRPLGERGERVAATYLRRRGYLIVERGYANRYGEIDIVAVQQRTVVFVEVKTRRGAEWHAPLDAVTLDKQQKLSRISLSYLKHHDLLDCSTRFDVIGIVWPQGQRRPDVTHITNAFEPRGIHSLFY